MEGRDLSVIGFEKARAALKLVVHERGLKASAKAEGYHQIWTRDSAISMIGALAFDEFVEPARHSLETLGSVQSASGWIPNNFDITINAPEHWGPDGYDNCAWFVIGYGLFYRKTGDLKFLTDQWPKIEAALKWLEFHESSQEMLYMGEAGDWMDVFSVRGHGLYVNVVYLLAAREGAYLAGFLAKKDSAKHWHAKAERLKDVINERFWFDATRMFWRLMKNRRITADWEHTYLQYLARVVKLPYYTAFLGHRDAGTYFDACANLLALLAGVAPKDRAESVLNYIDEIGMDEPYPTKTIYPTVHAGDKNWRDYFATLNLNLPHQYQNGGIWPFIGALQVMALVKAGRREKARQVLERLAQANQKGRDNEWEFNEWLHGRTGRPAGKPYQAWSAALYLAAYKAVNENLLPEIFR